MLTNKEAIRILKYERPSEEYVGLLKEAIDTAIEALSTEPIQLRQADTLIIATALQYLIEDEERHELDRASAKKLREQILKFGASMCADAAPQTTSDISQQHGEWIEIENGIYVCSFCKNRIEALIPPNYCPNCRADMRGGTE